VISYRCPHNIVGLDYVGQKRQAYNQHAKQGLMSILKISRSHLAPRSFLTKIKPKPMSWLVPIQ
jgi:hypothetical protein